ncbi:MAG: polysaccharide biosynthesis C-terminal domain-containing protein [Chloroflexota bacterium]|nr:polysaccharide biosynthesis C-terminal domain-containing protein [Chloroflexota bacterium]
MGIGRNTLIGLATDLTVFALGFLVSIVLAYSLGPQGRGVYVILVTTNVLLANVAHLSLWAACSALLGQNRYRLGEVNTAALLIAGGMGILCFGAASAVYLVWGAILFPQITYGQLLITLLLIPSTIYQVYWTFIMLGSDHVLTMNKLNLAVNVGNAAGMLLVVGGLHGGIAGFLAVWVVSSTANLIAAVVLAARIDPFAWPPSRVVFRDLLTFGLRTHGAHVAHQLFLRFDVYAVSSLVGVSGVGIYTLATSLAEKLWVPFNAIYASSLGTIMRLPPAESALLTAKISRTALLLMVSLALPFALVSPWLIPLLYPAAFTPMVLPLILLLIGTPGFAVMSVVNNYILGPMGRPGLLSLISWAQLLVSIPLYLGLILTYGIVGAAVASTLTYWLALAGTLGVFVRATGLPLRQVLLPTGADFRDYARVLQAALLQIRRRAATNG